DWFEVWSFDYWREYLGAIGGRIGWWVQRLCVRATGRAFVFSDVHGQRLAELGLRGPAVRLSGLYAGQSEPEPDAAAPSCAGRPPTGSRATPSRSARRRRRGASP